MKITVLLKEPGQPAVQTTIDNEDLRELQRIVGGYVESVRPFRDEQIVLLCNEDGKHLGLPDNIFIDNGPYSADIVVGNIIATAFNDQGDFVSLDTRQMEWVRSFFIANEVK